MTTRRIRHIPGASLDTNASGIADSTISNGSLRLSQFPSPPSSIPTSSEFGTPSPSRSLFFYSLQPAAHPSASPSRSQGFSGNILTPSSPPSPYDWHEGASSIDVDATEDRLLPTSFITSLLQQNSDLRKTRRTSYTSDAVSGISEITYPPPFNYPEAESSSSSRYPPGRHHRPYGARNPPSAFAPIPENNRISGDSETLHSTQEHSSIVRTASVSRGLREHGASVVGVAPATLYNISSRSSDQDPERHDSIRKGGFREIDDDSIVDYKVSDSNRSPALPSSTGTQRLVFGNSTRQPPPQQFRESVHSSRSVAPSFISRISLASSLRRAFAWRRMKPLPPVPTVPHIPIATENGHRKAEEFTPLPNLIDRAGILHQLLEKGHQPHHSFTSYHGLSLSGGVTTAFEVNRDSNAWQASASELPTKARPRSRPWSLFCNNKRICLSLTLLIGVLLVGIITAVVMTQRNHHSSTCANDLAGAACNLSMLVLHGRLKPARSSLPF